MDPFWTPVLLAVGAGLLGLGVHWVRWRILVPNREAHRAGRERLRASIALERERLDAVATGIRREGLEAELEAERRAADAPFQDDEDDEGDEDEPAR